MKQKTYSDIRPEKNFSIENIENGKCTVLFFDDIQEEKQESTNMENQEIVEKNVYSYDIYSIEVPYRENLEEVIESDISNWLKDVKQKAYDKAAEEIRKKRNKLLEETDKEMCLDRLNLKMPEELTASNLLSGIKEFFEGLSNIFNGKMAKYRQELRDITKQEGFPYNVVWPKNEDQK